VPITRLNILKIYDKEVKEQYQPSLTIFFANMQLKRYLTVKREVQYEYEYTSRSIDKYVFSLQHNTAARKRRLVK